MGLLLVAVQARPAAGEDGGQPPRFSPEAAAIFQKRCMACHTFGNGVKVGPDLKGVTQRRQRSWLLRFIRGSSTLIVSGDPTATELFQKFRRQRMPDWSDLSEKQVGDILDYLDVGGPDIKPADERTARSATAPQIERGRQLFRGDSPFRTGAQACAACHAVRDSAVVGGTLGPDLTGVYGRYRGQSLTNFLHRPSSPWFHAGGGDRYLSPEDAFAIKAYLWKLAAPEMANGAAGAAP